MRVIALKTFTYKDNTVSMARGQVAEIDDDVANELIEDGYVKKWVGKHEDRITALETEGGVQIDVNDESLVINTNGGAE